MDVLPSFFLADIKSQFMKAQKGSNFFSFENEGQLREQFGSVQQLGRSRGGSTIC